MAYDANEPNEPTEAIEPIEPVEPIEKAELTTDHTSHTSHESHTTHEPHPSPQKLIYAVIREALAEGEGISLPGVGSFSVALHAARMGRNPRTGESIAIPARRRIHFKVAKGLGELLNP